MKDYQKNAEELHKNVPPNWYYESLKVDLLQRFWHKRRFSEVSKVIEPNGGRILDVGCADGMFSKVIFDKSKAEELIGVDVLKGSVNWAKKHWVKNKRMEFRIRDAHNLNFKPQSFDTVFILEVLEHVEDPEKVLRSVKKILRKGGYGVFLVPSDSLLFRLVWFLWLHFYPRGWVWRDTHIRTYRDNNLLRLCKKMGFKIEIDKKFNLGMLQLIKVRKK